MAVLFFCLDCLSVFLAGLPFLAQTSWKTPDLSLMTFYVDIYGAQRMNPADFFSGATCRVTFAFLCEMPQLLVDIGVQLRITSNKFGDLFIQF